MIKTRFIFAVSFCAMIAAGAVHADTATTGIAGVSYVDRAVGTATTAANNAQISANNANAAAGKAQTSADNAQDAADAAQKSADDAAESATAANTAVTKKQDKSTAAYQMGNASGGWTTMTAAQQNALNSGVTSAKVTTYDGYEATIAAKQTTANIVSDTSDYNDDIASTTKYPSMAVAQDMASQAAAGAVASKVNTAQGSSAANKAVITNSSGNITTGTITSGMITDGTVATVDIADSAVTTAKIAASAVTSAKIADSNVTTAKIAAGAVTAAKTTGIYGYIPSGGEGSTTATATIWVE